MLREKRKSLYLSQEEVSIQLGISRTTLSLIENRHKTDLCFKLMKKICNVYHIRLEELISWLES